MNVGPTRGGCVHAQDTAGALRANPALAPVMPLIGGTLFMISAGYGHPGHLDQRPWLVAALVSWTMASFECQLQVPANRIGQQCSASGDSRSCRKSPRSACSYRSRCRTLRRRRSWITHGSGCDWSVRCGSCSATASDDRCGARVCDAAVADGMTGGTAA